MSSQSHGHVNPLLAECPPDSSTLLDILFKHKTKKNLAYQYNRIDDEAFDPVPSSNISFSELVDRSTALAAMLQQKYL